jgi:alkylhydroperoxidase/carboxymuconolactone decarboxylase family protein YurZ
MTTTTASTTSQPAPTQIKQPNVERRRLSPDDVRQVAPALEKNTQDRLYGEVWNRPGLSKRDRSLVTVTALIARGQTGALTYYFDQALENGVKPGEISEVITHLAYYSGWGNAFAAVGPADRRAELRGGRARRRPVHDRCAVPRPLAAAGPRGPRPESGHGQRPRRHRTGRADHLPPRPGDGQRADSGAGVRGDDPVGLLRGLAERVLGAPGREGRVREAVGRGEVTGRRRPLLKGSGCTGDNSRPSSAPRWRSR